MRPIVLLLREPEELYHSSLTSNDYQPLFISVLSDRLENEGEFKYLLRSSAKLFWGVVSTSKRASTYFRSVQKQISFENGHNQQAMQEIWSKKVYFAPDEITAQPLRDMQYDVKLSGFSGSEELLDSSLLSKFVQNYIENLKPSDRTNIEGKKLLILTGDKTAENLTAGLTEKNIPSQLLQIYSTYPNPNLKATLEVAQNKVVHKFDWIVFFSPFGVDLALPALKESPNWEISKIAAIGKATEAHLESQDVEVDIVPDNPTPDSLVEAINAATSDIESFSGIED